MSIFQYINGGLAVAVEIFAWWIALDICTALSGKDVGKL